MNAFFIPEEELEVFMTSKQPTGAFFIPQETEEEHG